MGDNTEEQATEVEALAAIFADDFESLLPHDDFVHCFKIHLEPFPGQEGSNHVSCNLMVGLRKEYPLEAPDLVIESTTGMRPALGFELQAFLRNQAEQRLGGPMIYDVAQEGAEWLKSHNVKTIEAGSAETASSEVKIRAHLAQARPSTTEASLEKLMNLPWFQAERVGWAMSWLPLNMDGFEPRTGHTLAIPSSDPLYAVAIGGINGSTSVRSASFNIETRKWQVFGPTLSGSGHVCLPFIGHRFVVIGGLNNQTGQPFAHVAMCPDDVHEKQGSSVTSVYYPEAALSRRNHTAVYAGSSVLVFAGKSNGIINNDLLLATGAKNFQLITARGEAPAPRFGHCAVVLNHKMYIHGGRDKAQKDFADLMVLDMSVVTKPSQWHWEVVQCRGKIPEGRSFHTMNVVGDRLLMFGGLSNGQYLNELLMFVTEANVWTRLIVTGIPPAPRSGHASVILDGHLLVCGGFDGKHWLGDGFLLENATSTDLELSSLVADMAAIRRSELFSDVEIVADGCIFRAHRFILDCRAKEFHSAYPATEPRIYVEGMSSDAMEAVLHYIYTDSCIPTDEVMKEVQGFARKHRMPRLAAICDFIAGHRTTAPDSTFSADILACADRADYADLEIDCGGEHFQFGHAALLCQRSPFFHGMLTTGLREARTKRVQVRDVDPIALHYMLKSLYGSFEPVPPEAAVETLLAADLYSLPMLKRQCESTVKRFADVTNVCTLLALADQHNTPSLMQTCMVLALRHFHEISQTDEWHEQVPAKLKAEIERRALQARRSMGSP